MDLDDDIFNAYDDIKLQEILMSSAHKRFGEIAPRITGSISAISSALIIFLILKSSTQLRELSTYHNIMVAMSFFDILASVAMALTHLPMPREGISESVDEYNYQGLRIGNTQTCTAQGYFVSTGTLTAYTFNMSLCIYFACVIYFRMKKEVIRKKIEPLLLFLPPITCISLISVQLFNENLNPTGAWCGVGKCFHYSFFLIFLVCQAIT